MRRLKVMPERTVTKHGRRCANRAEWGLTRYGVEGLLPECRRDAASGGRVYEAQNVLYPDPTCGCCAAAAPRVNATMPGGIEWRVWECIARSLMAIRFWRGSLASRKEPER
jgi:hypothetical protein